MHFKKRSFAKASDRILRHHIGWPATRRLMLWMARHPKLRRSVGWWT